ncbi:MAG TPA: CHASE2 domain-containing protein [Casimicrobiaceae bacterium]|nr:CHASE2 domain-containing protein [Casimicrobiaceae bacterium]
MSDPPAADPPASSQGRIRAIGLALLVAIGALIWLQPYWNARLQSAAFDLYQRASPRKLESTPVTVVEIDEPSLARLGQWPWPRTVLAELVRRITNEGPAAIGIDILMPEPDRMSPEQLFSPAQRQDPALASALTMLPSGDAELARAIALAPVALAFAGTLERSQPPPGPSFVTVDRNRRPASTHVAAAGVPYHAGALTNLEAFDRAAAGHGLISAGPVDDVIRRVPLAARIDDRLVPSLPIEMLRVALHARDLELFVDGTTVEAIAVGHFVAPTEADGELRVYYTRRDPRRTISAIDLLGGRADPQRFERKLVLIGTSGLALADYQNTPLGERMPGVEIQAQVLENLVDQTWLDRPSWAPALELALFALPGLILIAVTPRWKPRNAALLATALIALLIGGGVTAFIGRHLVLDAAAPALGLLVLFSFLLLLTSSEATRQERRLEELVRAQREQSAYVAGELQAAKRIQTGFLPRTDFLSDERRVELAASMTPAREVGGDLYDFFLLDADHLFFLIGDVAGKGVSASLFMAVSKALYKSATLRGADSTIGELMRAANIEVSRDNPEMFFLTVFTAVLDLRSGEVEYCNAGHEDPNVLEAGATGLARLAGGAGPPLCAVEHFAYESAEARLRPGAVLCLVTDGVADARNHAGERYGSARLGELLLRLQASAAGAQAVVDAIGADLRSFAGGAEAADDITVLALRWLGPAGQGAG